MKLRLKEILNQKGWTAYQLAQACREFVTEQNVYAWVRGEYAPDLKNVKKICGILGVSVDEMLADETPSETE